MARYVAHRSHNFRSENGLFFFSLSLSRPAKVRQPTRVSQREREAEWEKSWKKNGEKPSINTWPRGRTSVRRKHLLRDSPPVSATRRSSGGPTQWQQRNQFPIWSSLPGKSIPPLHHHQRLGWRCIFFFSFFLLSLQWFFFLLPVVQCFLVRPMGGTSQRRIRTRKSGSGSGNRASSVCLRRRFRVERNRSSASRLHDQTSVRAQPIGRFHETPTKRLTAVRHKHNHRHPFHPPGVD